MTGDEIHEKTCQLATRYSEHCLDDQKVRHFAASLEREDDGIVFEGLIPFFETSGYDGDGTWRQEVAGRLLAFRMPKPQRDLEALVLGTAPHYNLSVEQFPWYLALAFGRDTFRTQVSSLLDGATISDRNRKTLDTFLYWTSLPEDEIRHELNAQ